MGSDGPSVPGNVVTDTLREGGREEGREEGKGGRGEGGRKGRKEGGRKGEREGGREGGRKGDEIPSPVVAEREDCGSRWPAPSVRCLG